MSTIPVYRRQQLASSLVGTPSVSTGSAQLLSQTANQMANLQPAINALGSQVARGTSSVAAARNQEKAAQTDMILESTARVATAFATMAKTQVVNDVVTADLHNQFRFDYDTETQKIQKEFSTSPDLVREKVRDAGYALSNRMALEIPDEKQRAAFLEKALPTVESQTHGQVEWAAGQENANATQALGNIEARMVKASTEVSDLNGLRQLLGQTAADVLPLKALGAKSVDATRKIQESQVRAFIGKQMVVDPITLYDQMEQGVYNEFLPDGKDREQVFYDAKAKAGAFTRVKQHEEVKQIAQVVKPWADMIEAGTATPDFFRGQAHILEKKLMQYRVDTARDDVRFKDVPGYKNEPLNKAYLAELIGKKQLADRLAILVRDSGPRLGDSKDPNLANAVTDFSYKYLKLSDPNFIDSMTTYDMQGYISDLQQEAASLLERDGITLSNFAEHQSALAFKSATLYEGMEPEKEWGIFDRPYKTTLDAGFAYLQTWVSEADKDPQTRRQFAGTAVPRYVSSYRDLQRRKGDQKITVEEARGLAEKAQRYAQVQKNPYADLGLKGGDTYGGYTVMGVDPVTGVPIVRIEKK